jgi:hypothetical protein
MLEYKTVRGTDSNTFDDLVNSHIDQGYELQGGISITAFSERGGMTCLLAQAMVRTVEDKPSINSFDSK